MKYTLRAVLALGLLAGFYLLALAIIGCFGFVIYAFLRLGVPGRALAIPILLGVFVTYSVGTAVVASIRAGRETPDGMLLTPDAQPELWSRIRALADQVGTRPPDEIRLVPEVNASVAETTKLLGLAAGTRRMTIGVPLLLGLTRGQLAAVLAHELGHYSGRHTALATTTYRGGEALRRVLHELGEDSPVGSVFAMYAGLYFRVSSGVSRRQELEADETAARIAGRDVTIAALLRLAPLDAAWQFFLSGYLGAAHRLGLRPTAIAEGFLDLLDDPERQSQLALVREDERHAAIFDSHPTTSRRVALLGMLPDGGEEDDELPGFAVLTEPDQTMATFFATMYAEESELEPADWERIGAAVSQHDAEARARHLVRAVRTAPWRGGREVTLEVLASELRSGRGPEYASRVANTRTTAEQRELAGLLVGSLIGVKLVERGLASYRLDWSGSDRLVDRAGRLVDVLGLGNRAVGSDRGVAELMAFAEDHGIAPAEVLDFAESGRDDSEPMRVLGCIAPLQLGMRWVMAFPCTTGLLIVRPRGTSEWVALSAVAVASGTARKLAFLVLRAPIDQVLERPGAKLVAWDKIAFARLAERFLRGDLLTLTTVSGGTRRLKVVRQTDTYGDPWNPWDVVRHFLGDRFVVQTLAGGRRTGSRAGVLEP